jgi:hypothetical protein
MTTDNALAALRLYIQSRDSLLAALTIHITGDDTTLDPPYISITETGNEEHEVSLGVITLSVEVKLASVVGETADAATTDTAHRALATELHGILTDYETGRENMDTYPYFSCFDIRAMAPRTITEDGRRVTVFPLRIVCE